MPSPAAMQAEVILTGRCPKWSRHILSTYSVVEKSGERRIGVECLCSCGLKVSLPQEAVIRLILHGVAEANGLSALDDYIR